MDLDPRAVAADIDQALEPALVIDRTSQADRLVGRSEMRVAADLDRDVAAQPTEKRDILALGRFAQAPPDMQLVETVRRPAATFDEQCRFAEIPDEVVELGRNISGV